ncbi:MAG: glycosyltransferase [Methylacidiphilales bacterium]|nr:glycosyltransferase [Candidatus Methylacidiphilales bacterium]
MRILLVISSLAADRAEATEVKSTIQALLECGHEVGALYVQNGPAYADQHPRLTHLPVTYAERKSSPAIANRIGEFQPDVTHIVACWTPFHARVSTVLRRLKRPYVLEPCGHLIRVHLDHRFAEKPSTPLHSLGRRIYQTFYDIPMLKHAAQVRSLSAFEAHDLHTRFGVDSQIISWGFNPEWLTAARLSGPEATRPVRFLFVGRVDIFQKGLDLILQAAILLNKQGLTSHFTVTFAGPEENHAFERIGRIIRREGLTNVSLHPPVYGEGKDKLFAASDVFLHPSRFEGIAKLAREASGAGLAVLASDDSNYGDWVHDNRIGISAGLTAEEQAAAMKQWIDHPPLASEMGKRGFEYAKAWPWLRVAAELESCYKSATTRAS